MTPKIVSTKWLSEYCPKCHSRLYLDRDTYGQFKACLCGYTKDIDASPKLNLHLEDLNKDKTH
jgi:DNA-directed RNA polymerase subunit M/transcription elongation factor TFIIS